MATPLLRGEIDERAYELASVIHRQYPAPVLAHAYTAPECNTIHQLLEESGADPAWAAEHLAWLRSVVGVEGAWRLIAGNPDGRALMIGGSPGAGFELGERARDRWRKVAAHLASAYRLRLRLDALEEAEAVFDPGGAEVHLGEHAEARRAILAEAVELFRGVRERRLTGEAALEAWTALLDGRWSIVERVDTDGQRFIVAHRNEAPVPTHRTLSQREREVAEYAAHGHPNAFIAYELGLADATVAAYLHAALAKLGLQDRTELILARQAVAHAVEAKRRGERSEEG